MDNETKDQLTEHITSILAMIDKVTTGGDNYTDTYADDEHDDDDGHDDDDTLEPTEIEITYTLQVNFTDVTPVIWAEIPVVRDNDGWRPTGYGAKLVGWWGNIGDSRGLPYTVAEALVKRYGELAK
jgi:hypothetical protein